MCIVLAMLRCRIYYLLALRMRSPRKSYTFGFVEQRYLAFVARTHTSCCLIPLKYWSSTIPVMSTAYENNAPKPPPNMREPNEYNNELQPFFQDQYIWYNIKMGKTTSVGILFFST